MFRAPILLVMLAGAAAAGGLDRPSPLASEWRPTSCPTLSWPGRELRCGLVGVPLRHDRPDGPTLDLTVIVAGSRAARVAREPVMFLHGGPGANVRSLLSALSTGQVPDTAPDRDLIFFDQRSTDASPFARECFSGVSPARRVSLALGPVRERVAAEVSGALACRTELLASGFDPEILSTAQNAADVDAIRRALRVPAVNLYGVSYGSRLAQEVARQFPNTVRSMLLDGPVPLNDASLSFAQLLDSFLGEVFDACARDTACAALFPNAAANFEDWLQRVDAEPPLAALSSLTPRGQEVRLNVAALLEWLPLRAGTPTEVLQDLDALQREKFRQVEVSLETFGSQTKWSTTSVVVGCRDGFIPLPQGRPSLRFPLLADAFDPLDAGTREVCRKWNAAGPPASGSFAPSKVPTLVFVGAFDPITPPRNAELLRAFLPYAQVVRFVFGSHGQLRPGPAAECAAGLAGQFWKSPSGLVGTTCARTAGRDEAMTP